MANYGPYFGVPTLQLSVTDYAPPRGVHDAFVSACATPSTPLGMGNRGMLGTDNRTTQPKVRFAAVTDGLSNTICVAELAGRPQLFWKGQPQNAQVLNASWADYNTSQSLVGWNAGAPTPTFTPPPPAYVGTIPPSLLGCQMINVINSNSMYSWHPGGVNALMGDGSVRFLPANTASATLAALITREGGETLSNSN